ncbi:hypothetical protein PGQ11_006188 [Apiospora arundinis]|uniref:Uncharacterized protein n=1 Tax=Apiospora arundinis TaxID=335852 RepID=A0ABR2IRZ1_9PEZI
MPARFPLRDIWKRALHPWIWEVLLCVASSCLMVAIAAILLHVDGRSQEEWRLGITLNSLINILSTLFRACLASTAAEVISQQKWIWFWSAPTSGRPIGQVQTFEEGSRSSLGALKLLTTVALQYPFIVLPIAILLSSLTIGPFAQQSIRTVYQEMPSPLGTATLPLSNSINSTNAYFRTFKGADFSWWSLNSDSRSVIFNALANPSSKDSTISPVCPTGNCSFPILSAPSGITHTSLGVCSTCTDVGSLVQQWANTSWIQGRKLYSLPNGMQLETYDTTAWLSVFSGYKLTWAEGLMTPEHTALSRWAFTNTTVLTMSLDGLPNVNKTGVPATPVAVACSLYPCVRSYAAKVRGNELSEVVVDSTPLVPDAVGYSPKLDLATMRWKDLIYASPNNYSLAAIQPFCQIDGKIYSASNGSDARDAKPVRLLTVDASPEFPTTMANQACITRVENLAYYLIGGTYSKFLNDTCSWDTRNGDETACDDRWWLAQFWEHKSASVQTVTNRFDAIAGATTNQIRLGLLRGNGTAQEVNGMALRQVPYTRIEWAWLILPTVLLALDILMLLGMVVRSVRRWDSEAVWKSNPLPLLYYKSRFVGSEMEPVAGADRSIFLSSGFEPLMKTSSPYQQHDRLLTSAELASVAQTVKVQFHQGVAGKAGNDGVRDQPVNHDDQKVEELSAQGMLQSDSK